MTVETIVKAWKDKSFRESLSPEQLKQLPENPVGSVELPDSLIESQDTQGPLSTCDDPLSEPCCPWVSCVWPICG